MALPAGGVVEIRDLVTPGVWTDVTQYLDKDAFTIHFGRTSPYAASSAATLSGLRFNNTDGRFTPKSQVLADGVTVHPYYPNLVPRRLIRYRNTPAGTRFTGEIQGWPPSINSNGTAWVMITATDVMRRLSAITLNSPILQDDLADLPVALWPLNDAAGSLTAAPRAGGAALAQSPGTAVGFPTPGSTGVGTFGVTGFGSSENGTALNITPTKSLSTLASAFGDLSSYTMEVWVNFSAWATNTLNIASLETLTAAGGAHITVDSTGLAKYKAAAPGFGLALNTPALLTLAVAADGSYVFYVNGVNVESDVAGTVPAVPVGARFAVGDVFNIATSGLNVNIGYAALYLGQLSAARVASHYAAGSFIGGATGACIQRLLAANGYTSADWSVDTGVATVNSYPQSDKSLLTACQDMAVTEGGGSAFYVSPNGKFRFADRNFRIPGSPVLTVTIESDDLGDSYSPTFDDQTLINTSTVTRSSISGTLSTQTYADVASVALYQRSDDSVTTYTSTDDDALHLAQSRVAQNSQPGFRLPQIVIDLMTAQNSLYASLANIQIGSRIRVTNLKQGFAPATQIDCYVEGWTETVGPDQYTFAIDASPADNPPDAVWEDATYGRWQAEASTLNTTITNSGTTVVIATSSGPTWSTASGDYPMLIKINEEILQLNGVPGGSTSPQTWTGVTRGVSGTTASAQSSGSTVDVYPTVTWTL